MNSELSNPTIAQSGDLAQLVSPTNKVFIVRLSPGQEFHTHRGIIKYDELIGQPWGTEVFTHAGKSYTMLQPALSDVLQELTRNTQIMYTKDIGYVLMRMGIGPGITVLEAGTGSGALTIALAWSVGPQGRVISYEVRPEMQNLARKNLDKLGLLDRVTLKSGNVADGFDETNVDALFLDLPNSYDYLPQVRRALKPGGFFGTILPTTNQVIKLLDQFYPQNFAFVDVAEVLLRHYKPVADRFRPVDRMVAHTGFLIFARPMLGIRRKLQDARAGEIDADANDASDYDAIDAPPGGADGE